MGNIEGNDSKSAESGCSKALIIKLGALGDVLRTTFLPKLLKRKYPDCNVTWVTSASALSLLKGNSDIDHVIPFGTDACNALVNDSFDIVYSLDDEQEVCQFATNITKKELHGSYLDIHGKCVYTNSVESWFGMGLLRSKDKGGKERADQLKALNRKTYQDIFVDMLGFRDVVYNVNDLRPNLPLTLEELNYGHTILKDLGLQDAKLVIGVNAGAGKRWALKWLPEEKTAALCDRLVQELGATVLLLGGVDEKDRNLRIQSLCKEHIHFIEPVVSPRMFSGVLNACDLIIASDSLALHLGLALEKKTVAFFGPTSPYEIELFGLGERVFKLSKCLCCYRKDIFSQSCIDLLQSEDLFFAVQSVLEQHNGIKRVKQ